MRGTTMILRERRRQIEELGYTAAHDSKFDADVLMQSILRLAARARLQRAHTKLNAHIRRHDTLDQLAKAGALCAAAIDRIQAGGIE